MASTTQLLVMSDSHGDKAVIQSLKDYYRGKVKAIFHNGDSEIDSTDPIWQGVAVVRGNCDTDGGYPNRLLTVIDDVRIAQTHGHLYGINFGWQNLDYWAAEMQADICLYGHLHVPDAVIRNKTLFINPGSVTQPRGLINEKLYALITIEPDAYRVDFYNLDHKQYPGLSNRFLKEELKT